MQELNYWNTRVYEDKNKEVANELWQYNARK